MKAFSLAVLVGLVLSLGSLSASAEPPKTLKLKAKLVEVPKKFPPDDLYDYAYVMKYKGVDGVTKGKTLYVAHYKPRQRRNKFKGKMKKIVAGKLKRFRRDAVHQLELVELDKKIWKGAVIDDYFAKDRKGQRYWCLRVDPAKK